MRAKLFFVSILLALFAVASGTNQPAAALTNCDTNAASYDAEEQAFLGLINAHRQQNGLGPLAASGTLNRAAAWKSQHLGANSYFAHDDTPINRTWVQRIRDCGYGYNTYIGENIAAGMASATDAFNAWKNSPGHNANMLGTSYTAIGIGRANVPGSPYTWYWSTEFGGYSDGTAPPTPTPTPTHAPPPGSYPCSDFTGDGLVRIGDILYVIDYFATSDAAADIDNNGTVNAVDILIVVGQFNTTC